MAGCCVVVMHYSDKRLDTFFFFNWKEDVEAIHLKHLVCYGNTLSPVRPGDLIEALQCFIYSLQLWKDCTDFVVL